MVLTEASKGKHPSLRERPRCLTVQVGHDKNFPFVANNVRAEQRSITNFIARDDGIVQLVAHQQRWVKANVGGPNKANPWNTEQFV